MVNDIDTQSGPTLPSPCVGICTLQGAHCYGCGRTSNEIAAWDTLSAQAQSAVWAELPGRLAAFGFKTFRLAAGPAVIAAFIGRTFAETTGHWRLVSPALETGMLISSDDRPDIVETDQDVRALSSNGDGLRLVKHAKARIFGFAANQDSAAMDTVVVVLPKGRAQRDLKQTKDALPSDYLTVAAPDAFTELAIKSKAGHGAIKGDLDGASWPEARAQLTALLAAGTIDVAMRNALGGMQTSCLQLPNEPPAPDANAPSDVKISRAFFACAVFRGDDPDWLAAALAP